MVNVKLGNKTYEGVLQVMMDTPDGGTVLFDEANNYVIGTPVEVTLSADSWNGSRYSLKVEGYAVGPYGLQIGIPSASSVINTQAMIEAALTISDHGSTAANAENGTAAYITAVIAAVNAPSTDLTIWLFGLEAA